MGKVRGLRFGRGYVRRPLKGKLRWWWMQTENFAVTRPPPSHHEGPREERERQDLFAPVRVLCSRRQPTTVTEKHRTAGGGFDDGPFVHLRIEVVDHRGDVVRIVVPLAVRQLGGRLPVGLPANKQIVRLIAGRMQDWRRQRTELTRMDVSMPGALRRSATTSV